MNNNFDNNQKGQGVVGPDNNELVNSEIIDKDVALFVSEMIKARERLGISQVKLAELTGIKQSAISRMESYRVPPQLDTIMRILNALGLKLSITELPFKNRKEHDIMNIKMGSVNKVHAEVVYCNLDIQKSDDDNFHFLTEHDDEFSVEVNNINALIIKQIEHKNIDDIFKEPLNATLKIPQAYCGDAFFCGRTEKDFNNNLDADERGTIRIKGLTLRNTVIYNYHTNLECENLSCESLKTETRHANAVCKQTKGIHALEFTGQHSELVIEKTTARNLILSTQHTNAKFSDGTGNDMKVAAQHSEVKLTNLMLENTMTVALQHSDVVCENVISTNGQELTLQHSDLVCNGISAAKLDFRVQHSDANIKNVKTENAKILVQHSDIELLNARIYNVDLNGGHSDCNMQLVGKADDYSLSLNSEFGNINIADTEYDDKINYTKAGNSENKKINIVNKFGDITVEFIDKE